MPATISMERRGASDQHGEASDGGSFGVMDGNEKEAALRGGASFLDRKSTRLNSSH